jgi:hypothetical protein
MKPSLRVLACASLLLLAPHSEPASACGGPDIVDVGELMAAQRSLVAELLEDPWEGSDLADFRFLRPFELAGRDPQGLFALAMLDPDAASDAPPAGLPKVDLAPWLGALQDGKLDAAKQAAQKIVDQVLDLPAPLAAANGSELQRSVEFLELSSSLAGVDKATLQQFFILRTPSTTALPKPLREAKLVRDTPRDQLVRLLEAQPQQARAASLELVRLSERVHKELPDGWPGEIAADKAVWDSLEHGYDAWLTAHGSHPLRDFATLSKLRVLFLRGDGKRAWELLLGLYPRHMLRVAWEMRHLLLAGQRFEPSDVARIPDNVLATALLRESSALTPQQWTRLWKRSEQEPNAAWAINLQERLFVQAMRLAELGQAPSDLPGPPRKRSQRWADLHAAALLAAHRDQEALAQAALLDVSADRVAAKLRAAAHMRGCDWVHVAEDARHLGAESLQYVLEVLVDEAALRTLQAQAGELAPLAAHALSLRLLGDDQWAAAAEVWQSSHSDEAQAWRDAAQLAADKSLAGSLAFAKWLLGSAGARIFPDATRAYSRGLKLRLDALDAPASPLPAAACASLQERPQLVALLLRGGRRERALPLYAAALRELAPNSKQARATLKTADALYNQLLSWDVSSSTAYPKLLAASPSALALREAGKRLRSPAAPH